MFPGSVRSFHPGFPPEGLFFRGMGAILSREKGNAVNDGAKKESIWSPMTGFGGAGAMIHAGNEGCDR